MKRCEACAEGKGEAALEENRDNRDIRVVAIQLDSTSPSPPPRKLNSGANICMEIKGN